MGVGKGPDSEAIGRIQLFLKKIAADVLDLCQLEQAGCRKKSLNVRLFDDDRGRVAKVEQQLHGILVDVFYDDLFLFKLLHASDDGSEVKFN